RRKAWSGETWLAAPEIARLPDSATFLPQRKIKIEAAGTDRRIKPACPGRGAAFFTLLRRTGTHGPECNLDPGSAAHHAARHSASKTRVNALMALRSIRGTASQILRPARSQ